MVVETYSTTAFAPSERAGHWSRIIAETYFPLTLTYRDPARFSGLVQRRQAGPASLSRLRTGPASYERDIHQIRQCNGEDYLITVPAVAPVTFRQLGRDVTCAPGGFLIERGDEPYRFAYDVANDLLVMKLPRSALAARLRQPDRFCATAFDGTSEMGGLFVETVRRTHAMSGGTADTNILGRHLVELLALTLDRSAETQCGAATPVRAAHLKRAQDMIRRNLRNRDLGPETVAKACGISRRYLHEVFAETETTVAQYITGMRLSAARDFLTLPGDLSLAQVAYRFGFGDQAQFARQFRAAFGQTPSSFRANHRTLRLEAGDGADPPPPSPAKPRMT